MPSTCPPTTRICIQLQGLLELSALERDIVVGGIPEAIPFDHVDRAALELLGSTLRERRRPGDPSGAVMCAVASGARFGLAFHGTAVSVKPLRALTSGPGNLVHAKDAAARFCRLWSSSTEQLLAASRAKLAGRRAR